MQYLKVFLMTCMICLLTGCAAKNIDSDFPTIRDAEEYFPLMHFPHMTDFDHLQKSLDLIFSDAYESC